MRTQRVPIASETRKEPRRQSSQLLISHTDGEGFEPSLRFHANTLSRRIVGNVAVEWVVVAANVSPADRPESEPTPINVSAPARTRRVPALRVFRVEPIKPLALGGANAGRRFV